MNNFSVKSILLGIAIGIILTSIAGILSFLVYDPLRNLSEKDLLRIEKEYGLVSKIEKPISGD